MTTNILIAGVGGQGLVLTTRVISMVALQSGFDVKTTDVIGLAQARRHGVGERAFWPSRAFTAHT